jgi:beta-glucosidase
MRVPSINPYSRNEYREGIFVGYRGYEKNGVKPLFPFGYGLSYTTFEYSDLNIVRDGDEFVASFNVKNTGKVAGAEVAQVYVTDNECSVVRPAKELKGFEKVFLQPGQSKRVEARLGTEAFRFYSLSAHDFIVEPGLFTVSVGSSSADIRLTSTLTL